MCVIDIDLGGPGVIIDDTIPPKVDCNNSVVNCNSSLVTINDTVPPKVDCNSSKVIVDDTTAVKVKEQVKTGTQRTFTAIAADMISAASPPDLKTAWQNQIAGFIAAHGVGGFTILSTTMLANSGTFYLMFTYGVY